MSRFKDVVKTSEDMRDKINTYYDVSVKDLVDLADHYQGEIELAAAAFRLGYLQGSKAERAKMKGGVTL